MPVTSLAPRLGGALIALTLVLAGCATTRRRRWGRR